MQEIQKFIINNCWRESSITSEVINPYNGQIAGIIYRPEPAHVEEAICSASDAFQKTKTMPSYKRAEILEKTSMEIKKRSDIFARILSLESGKPIKDARGEVSRAISTFKIAAEEASRSYGEVLPLDINQASGDRIGITRRFPIGPIAGISPFNFPLNLVAHKIAPCIASGNTMILKPASATPLTALLLGEALFKAGMIPGTVNIIPCSALHAQPLVIDERIKMITFTGSALVGWELKNRAGKKKVCLELGGNAAAIIEKDADLQFAVKRLIYGGFAYAGQICISVQRIYIHEDLYTKFLEIFITQVQKINVGNPLEEETDMGPMIDENSAMQIEKRIHDACISGAKILIGGKRRGNLFEPTVIENAPHNSAVNQEEAFAPIVVLYPFKKFEEAINLVNDSVYGLQTGVFTSELSKILLAFNRLEVGGVIINDIPTVRVDSMPYGGIKDSGFGREGVRYAMDEMSEIKIMVINNTR